MLTPLKYLQQKGCVQNCHMWRIYEFDKFLEGLNNTISIALVNWLSTERGGSCFPYLKNKLFSIVRLHSNHNKTKYILHPSKHPEIS